MNNMAQTMKKTWNTLPYRLAHFGVSGEREMLLQRFETLLTDKIDVTGKTIIDYGCGGGLLGLHLLSKFKIKKYIAYDISERSIERAKAELKKFGNTEFNLVPIPHSWDFRSKSPDIIACFACIIHFPTRLYLGNFMQECNKSNAEYLVFEIRDNGHGTLFQKKPYSSKGSVIRACYTSAKDIAGMLENYDLIDETELSQVECKTLTFRKKRDRITT